MTERTYSFAREVRATKEKEFDNAPQAFQRVKLARNGSFMVEVGHRVFLHPNFLGAIEENAKKREDEKEARE